MNTNILKAILKSRTVRWLAGLLAVAAVVGTVVGQSAPPTIPSVTLSPEPLYARGARAKPTLTLALSVEFPTVGAQYLGTQSTVDNTYSTANQYLGYFDTESCYIYNNTPTETPTGGAVADYKRFDRSGAATSRKCGGTGFSGNFMNWASSSAIDILRYGLAGGDRVVDTATLTVLQRAVLPNTSVSGNFWNAGNFPSKQLTHADAVDAVPTALLGTYTGTLNVANCLNRIHFGTAASGSCASPGTNSNLGTPTPAAVGPITSYSNSLPSDFATPACASENGSCSFTGVKQVAYGAGTHWYFASATSPVSCSNAVFGDPLVGTAKACYLRADPTGWTPPSSYGSSTLTSDGFFYSRVSVCASNSSGTLTDPRTSLCTRYPNGNYKPTGNLQKYSDRLRVAVFGYLNDNQNNPNQRYGGVLRSAMEYVGPTYYDANFQLVSGANPNQEWDPSSGIFLVNPDGNTTVKSGPTYTGPYVSGAINYLNQFGRTGVFGQYKTYDPVSELYYESLRYVQGLKPTPQAVSGVDPVGNPGLQDGYPAATSWTDPHPSSSSVSDYSCVRNNILTIGDVHTHNDRSIPGNNQDTDPSTSVNDFIRNANAAGNEPDYWSWTKVVGGFEAAQSVTYLDGNGVSRNTNSLANPNINSSLWGIQNQDRGDGASYYMAGLAYWGNTHDIRGAGWTDWSTASSYTTAGASTDPRRPGMRVSTYVIDVNEGGNSSDYNYRHGNQFFLAAKYGGFNDASGTGNPFMSPNPNSSTSATTPYVATNIDWQDPANPMEAKNYFLSSSASSVLNALNQIFASIAAQANSIAGGSISTQKLTSVNGYIYQAAFDASDWSGDLTAVTVSASGSTVNIGTAPIWDAGTTLNSIVPSARNIVIGKTTATTVATATPFLWDNLDADAQAALLAPPYAASGTPADPTATGQARLTYLRGDRTNESPSGLLMRKRTSALGDIVNSAVVFSGAPSQSIPDSSYATFATTYANRKHALFVGANDGMLHAFDPDNSGTELFGYIPSWMIPKLGALTSPSYQHQSYVDGTPAVAEALVGSNWKTVLVGGTGGGGQGVYALDVSDPNAFSASKVMWEFTDRDDADLGNVIGRPQILKLRTNAPGASATYKYFAVVASGVNNYVNDGHYSTTGSPALFLLDLSKSAGTAWSLGTNYYKISIAPSGGPLTTTATGMVGFSAVLGSAGEVASIYAGDLQGNLWKLDFTQSTAPSNWTLAQLSYFKNGSTAIPMYVALDATAKRQPITMEPAVSYGASRTLMVSFGTGKFLEVGDTTTPYAQQSVYALYDNNVNTADTATAGIAGRTALAQGTATAATSTVPGTITVPAFVWGRPAASPTGATPTREGWYYDFATSGERQISGFVVLNGTETFGSVIPSVSSCDAGSGNVYQVNVLTGGGSETLSPVGVLGEPFVVQIGGASSNVTYDTTGRGSQTTTYQILLQGATGNAAPSSLQQSPTQDVGRLSWREISNYQQLRQ